MKILVSSCLLGIPCRYCGDGCANETVLSIGKTNTFLAICPETAGGLPIPRTPSERFGCKVISKAGADVTENYRKGAEAALALARYAKADCAILKARSPSCGCGSIYDGTFTGTLIPGNGVTAQLLLDTGIPVYTEETCCNLLTFE